MMRFLSLYILLSLLVLCRLSPVQGQSKNPVRVELTANLDMEGYNFVPCAENGILVFFEGVDEGFTPDTKRWHFAFYDKNLKEHWLADTALIDGVKFEGFSHDGQYTYLFFLAKSRLKFQTNNVHILRVDYSVNEFKFLDISVPDKSEPVHFEVSDNKAFIAFNNAVFEPRISIVDLGTGSVQNIKPEVEGLNIIQEVKYDEYNREFLVVLDNYLGKRQNSLKILELSFNGTIQKTIVINPAIENKVLNEARIAFAGNDTLMVLGTYHNHASRIKANTEEGAAESAGYFVAKFVSDKQLLINYYNFLEFEELYRSLSSKTIADLRRKAEKQKEKGEEYSLDYTLMMHDVIPDNGNFTILAEAFYPEYRTVTNMYYDYYGRPMPQTYTVFDGYKYISGIAASFNKDGEILWDNGIEIKDIITFKLTTYVGKYPADNELALFYNNANKVHYKIVGPDYGGGASQSIALKSKFKGDKVMEDLGSRMIHWYDNYFLCYGYQVIKNNRVAGGKRTIFYFNKLAFN